MRMDAFGEPKWNEDIVIDNMNGLENDCDEDMRLIVEAVYMVKPPTTSTIYTTGIIRENED